MKVHLEAAALNQAKVTWYHSEKGTQAGREQDGGYDNFIESNQTFYTFIRNNTMASARMETVVVARIQWRLQAIQGPEE